jgi:predicted nucleotidyltransferase component of viral defense system
MKDIALQTARSAKGRTLNVLREYIQNELLGAMQKRGVHERLYFVGGTALRFLYQIPRFSEDLDFSAGPDWRPADFQPDMEAMAAEIRLGGYELTLHLQSDRTVQRAAFRFPGLLFELGLSSRHEQKLTISIEVDVRPPQGWTGERTIVNIYRPILIQHYDLRSLFTTKIATVLTRDYIKGRDYYDLFWYRSRWKNLTPILGLLKNAIDQKPERISPFEPSEWASILRGNISRLDWKTVLRDVQPFIERTDDLHVFTRENVLRLLEEPTTHSL